MHRRRSSTKLISPTTKRIYILKVWIIVYLCMYVFTYAITKVEYIPHA